MLGPMNVGISVPLPAYLVDVGFMAQKAEDLGFESFWCAEHPFIPVQSAKRFRATEDGQGFYVSYAPSVGALEHLGVEHTPVGVFEVEFAAAPIRPHQAAPRRCPRTGAAW